MAFVLSNFIIKDQMVDGLKLQNTILYNQIWFGKRFLKKFENDKLFYENEKYIIILDGILLNKKELFTIYNTDKLDYLIEILYESKGKEFFNEFRGSFSGAFYDKVANKCLLFTNQYGDQMLFYYCNNGKFVIGSNVFDIIYILEQNNIQISVNEQAVFSMLTFGYMSDDFTYAKEIKRLKYGKYIELNDGMLDVFTYYKLKGDSKNFHGSSEEEIINNIDELFVKAVKLEYDKDLEYGYEHLVEISGGLDSRMSLWIAKELKYDNITCITFAESGSADEKIAKSIARDLNLDIFHYSLDSANHIIDIEEYTRINYGLQLYGAVGGEKKIMDSFNMSKYGLMHTGQIGDVVIGTFIDSKTKLNDFSLSGLYSDKLIRKSNKEKEYIYNILNINKYDHIYENREQYLMSVRAFLGCLTAHLFTQEYTEVASPFLNIELIEYCLSLPIEMRINHYIYKKWILKKHPEAASYIWEKTGKRIDEKEYILLNKLNKALLNPKLVLRKLGMNVKYDEKILKGMNPMDLWWTRNEMLRITYLNYFDENISKIRLSSMAMDDLNYMFHEGTTIEKMMAITVISALKLYFRL